MNVHYKGSGTDVSWQKKESVNSKSTDIVQPEEQKEKRMKKNQQILRELLETMKYINLCIKRPGKRKSNNTFFPLCILSVFFSLFLFNINSTNSDMTI